MHCHRYSLEQMRDRDFLYDTIRMMLSYHAYSSWPIQDWAITREARLLDAAGNVRADIDRVKLSCGERALVDCLRRNHSEELVLKLACIAL